MTVYFCRAAYGPIKIGCTSGTAAGRVTAFGRKYGSPARLLATLEGRRTREAIIHSLLARHRIGATETFEPNDTVWQFILDVATGQVDWLPEEPQCAVLWLDEEFGPKSLRRQALELFGSLDAFGDRIGMSTKSFGTSFGTSSVYIRAALSLERLRQQGRIPAYLLDSMDYSLPMRRAA